MHMAPIVLQQPTAVPRSCPETFPARGHHLDGNGRWATSRGLPRSAGHRPARNREAHHCAVPAWASTHSRFFALSSANWKRPPAEVAGILRLLHEYLLTRPPTASRKACAEHHRAPRPYARDAARRRR